MSGKSTAERNVFLSTDVASRAEIRIASATVLAFAALFFALIPFAAMRLVRLAPLIPAWNAGLAISDLITAGLLLNRFSLLRPRASLMLASGYLFTAFITISYTLTYPARFSPTELPGAGAESTAWLYMFWHAGFPLFIIAYGLLNNERLPAETRSKPGQSSRRLAGLSLPAAIALPLAIAWGLTEVATAGHAWLPALTVDGQFTWRMTAIGSGIWILSLLSLFILWRRRQRSVLDIWLAVVMSAWICDIALSTAFSAGRYDLGFYAGRFYAMLAADFLPVVLLLENGKRYARLVGADSMYRRLLGAAPDAMVVVGHDGEIVSLNTRAEDQFGYSGDELVGRHVETIIPEGFTERLRADGRSASAEALAQQIGMGIELSGRRKNGSEFPIEIMLSQMESTDGILVTAAIRDISARREVEAQLLLKVAELTRSNGELEQFAYVASHDLQEPLRMVVSFAQLLSRRYKGKLDADADDFIAFAVDGASRMQRLIQDLLTYSRVGRKTRKLLPTSSETALKLALRNLHETVEQNSAEVTYEPLPNVLSDESELTQLFQNLVGNAIKYQNSAPPRIYISAARGENRTWVFSVRDNGLGIDPQYFDKIFGMFQRLHKQEDFAGTGIGLTICKKIVERHGGTISVESQPGHGSTFRFALPEIGD